MLEIARAEAAAGCHEALFTLGDSRSFATGWRARSSRSSAARRPRVPGVDRAARARGDRAAAAPEPGVMSEDDLSAPRPVSASMGIMLETAAERLSARGGPHFGRPTSSPRAAWRRSPRPGGHRCRSRQGSDRDRRDAVGADRGAARDPRRRRAVRPRPGGDRPELPRQARDAHGFVARAELRRAALDGRRGAASCSAPGGASRRRRT